MSHSRATIAPNKKRKTEKHHQQQNKCENSITLQQCTLLLTRTRPLLPPAPQEGRYDNQPHAHLSRNEKRKNRKSNNNSRIKLEKYNQPSTMSTCRLTGTAGTATAGGEIPTINRVHIFLETRGKNRKSNNQQSISLKNTISFWRCPHVNLPEPLQPPPPPPLALQEGKYQQSTAYHLSEKREKKKNRKCNNQQKKEMKKNNRHLLEHDRCNCWHCRRGDTNNQPLTQTFATISFASFSGRRKEKPKISNQ